MAPAEMGQADLAEAGPAEAPPARWQSDPILRVEHLTMRFGGLTAVGDLSFRAGRGDITALIGPNGAGKTTVFNCITGFYRPTEGRLALVRERRPGTADEIEAVTASSRGHIPGHGTYLLERLPGHDVNRVAGVARTFQNIRLFSGMTVLENLLVAQHATLMRASAYSLAGLFGLARYRRAERGAVEKALAWLERTGLADRADDPAGSLPYGDQRRLEIARALCTDPVLLCLDEPAAGLNPRESLELNRLLNLIRGEHGVSLLLIEHDMSVVMEISDHVVVLDYGRKIADGTPAEVRDDPRVIAAYLGVADDEVEAVEAEVAAEAQEAGAQEAPPAGPAPGETVR